MILQASGKEEELDKQQQKGIVNVV